MMKHFYSISLIVFGLVILYLSLRNNPKDWLSTLLLFLFVAVSVFIFFYYQKKRSLKK